MNEEKEVFILDYEQVAESSSIEDMNFKFLQLTGRDLFHKSGYHGEDVVVAVLDTGVSPHPEFEDRLLPGFNCTSGDRDNTLDGNMHGTHVAGSIAGKNVGVAPKAKILPVKVLGDNGAGGLNQIFKGLEYVKYWRGPNGETVDIVNMSLACSGAYLRQRPSALRMFYSLIKDLIDQGTIVFCAAGNSGRLEDFYPAAFDHVVTVGAVDVNTNTAFFTTRNKEVDVCQVGMNVVSARNTGGYVALNGTSMATPLSAGICAVLLGKYRKLFNKNLPEEILYEIVKLNTYDLGIEGVDSSTGAGFLSLDLSIIEELKG